MIPEILNQAIQIVYFLASPMIAVLFFWYLIAVILENVPRINRYFRIAMIPYALYAVLVLINPITDFLYSFNESQGFVFGKGFLLVYIIPALYMFAMIVFILTHPIKREKPITWILISFPVISILMLIIQWIFPTVILSGSGASAALLILYLYLQNKQIYIDDLTGMQNRKTLSKSLLINVERKRKMGIIMISLDDFSKINERFGQLSGDHFLWLVSQFLAKLTPVKSIFRYAGDEFIIILDETFSIRSVELVERIRNRFDDFWKNGSFRTLLSTCITVVNYPDHAKTAEDIIMLLEYCTNLSKKSGKGKTIYSSQETVDKLNRKSKIGELIKTGLALDTFVVFFQPIYSRKDKRFITAEALLRFSDSQLGAISPAELIPIAEEEGLIEEIGFMVLDKTCKFIKNLDDQKLTFTSISINISTLQLYSENFVDHCLDIIRSNGVSPDRLRMEITESVFVDINKNVEQVLRELGQNGIKLYMDDFGTGYANVANILNFPFENIKLDKSLLYDSVSDNRSFLIMKGLCKTFSEAGLQITIEGVETEEQRGLAEDINADFIQGYLFAHPMPPSEIIGYFEKTFPD
jgi:diguanylate cyclase (GGDEF)-like protein